MLRAEKVWTGIPAAGSIDDAPGSPQERAAALKEAAKQQENWTVPVAVPEAQGQEQEAPEWTYTALIKATLKAISEDDLDTEMALKAELMNKFRIPAGQVEADLLRHQMLLETAGDRKAKPPKSLNLALLALLMQPIHWLA